MKKFSTANFPLFMSKIQIFLRPKGRYAFYRKYLNNKKILDVGCGNNSPFIIKSLFPNCYYVGIDVGDFNQSSPNLADEYVLCSSEEFTSKISNFQNSFDLVVSSHNLEHCIDRNGTLDAMFSSVKYGGMIYLAFPNEESANFDKRIGTLNYNDDSTHLFGPPIFSEIIDNLKFNGFQVIYAERAYKPFLLNLLGLLLEPISRKLKVVLPGTWELYGFESIIWAKKLDHN